MEEDSLPDELLVTVVTPCEGTQTVIKSLDGTKYDGSEGDFNWVTLEPKSGTWQTEVFDWTPNSACYGRRRYRLDTPSSDPCGAYSFWTGNTLDPSQGTLVVTTP